MRRNLLDDSDGLRLTQTRSDVPCAWSETMIPDGTHAVGVRNVVDGDSRLAWCSIGSVDAMRERLNAFHEHDYELRAELSPSGCVRYNEVQGDQIPCATCGNRVPAGTRAISFSQPRRGARRASPTVWNHIECLDAFTAALDDVWQYTNELMPTRL